VRITGASGLSAGRITSTLISAPPTVGTLYFSKTGSAADAAPGSASSTTRAGNIARAYVPCQKRMKKRYPRRECANRFDP
jgi:hypothetical protein